MHNKHRRPAMAMIELIFALVIMGIVMMAAPTMISMATKTTNVALQQEGINEALTKINMILTYPWDERDVDTTCIPPVLRVSPQGDAELNEVVIPAPTGRRAGVPLLSNTHTFLCDTQRFNASAIGQDLNDAGTNDDIDDFNNNAVNVLVNLVGGAGGTDYIEQATVQITTGVRYISDAASYANNNIAYTPNFAIIQSTNIKQINVALTSTSGINELTKNIQLTAFSCNLGGIEYERRDF